MSTILSIIVLLFGVDRCQVGDMTAYEDMSYHISESDQMAVCDISQTDQELTYTEIVINSGQHFTIRRYSLVSGLPFPESTVVEYLGSGLIIDRSVQEPQ